jgi:muconate cycloisomerase
VHVASIESFPITLTLDPPIKMSYITIAESRNVLVKVTTDTGVVGWGEAVEAVKLTGENQARIVASLDLLAPMVIGEDPFQIPAIWERLTSAVHDNRTAIGALDIALHDIVGRAQGVPVHQILGGSHRHEVPSLTMVGSGDPQADAEDAARKYAAGYRWFKLKLGIANPETELAMISAVLATLGDDAVVCGDANGAWTEGESIAFMSRLADLPLRFLEQPVPGDDPEALVRIARQAPVPVCADESVHSVEDISRFAGTPIAGVSLKLIKQGGLTGVMRGAQICRTAGLHVNIAGKIAETAVAAAANVHAAAAIPEVFYGASPANQSIVQDVSRRPVPFVNGAFVVPEEPGLGVEVDEGLVEELRSR